MTTFEYEDGFLAEPFDHVCTAVRTKYAEYHALLRRVNRLATSHQHSIVIHIDSNVERYAACLFARTLATTQASVLLLERGLVAQARVLLRSALETLFALAAIAEEPNVVERLVEGYTAEQKHVAENMQRWKHPELKRIADVEAASGQLKALLESPATALSTFSLAQKGGLEDWYRTVYMVFSWSVHGVAADLDRHVVIGPDGKVAEFKNEPELDEQESSWLCAIEILLKSSTAVARIFRDIDQNQIEQLYGDAHALHKSKSTA